MMHTLLLFFAPGSALRQMPGAGRATREPQARPLRLAPNRNPEWLPGVMLRSARVLANAVGFVALLAACWLLLPVIALLLI
jgi:hypothetical protein